MTGYDCGRDVKGAYLVPRATAAGEMMTGVVNSKVLNCGKSASESGNVRTLVLFMCSCCNATHWPMASGSFLSSWLSAIASLRIFRFYKQVRKQRARDRRKKMTQRGRDRIYIDRSIERERDR